MICYSFSLITCIKIPYTIGEERGGGVLVDNNKHGEGWLISRVLATSQMPQLELFKGSWLKTYLRKLRRNILFQMGNLVVVYGLPYSSGTISPEADKFAIIYDVPPCKQRLLLKEIKV